MSTAPTIKGEPGWAAGGVLSLVVTSLVTTSLTASVASSHLIHKRSQWSCWYCCCCFCSSLTGGFRTSSRWYTLCCCPVAHVVEQLIRPLFISLADCPCLLSPPDIAPLKAVIYIPCRPFELPSSTCCCSSCCCCRCLTQCYQLSFDVAWACCYSC